MCPRVGLPPLLSSLLSAEYNWLCWASSANTWAGFTTKYERDLFTLLVRERDSPRNRTWAKESGQQRNRTLVTSFLTSVRVSHRQRAKCHSTPDSRPACLLFNNEDQTVWEEQPDARRLRAKIR